MAACHQSACFAQGNAKDLKQDFFNFKQLIDLISIRVLILLRQGTNRSRGKASAVCVRVYAETESLVGLQPSSVILVAIHPARCCSLSGSRFKNFTPTLPSFPDQITRPFALTRR
jgi:hypothetical protein